MIVPIGVDPWCWGLRIANTQSYLIVKLFSKNSNLCDHGTSMLRTDRRPIEGRTETDDLP